MVRSEVTRPCSPFIDHFSSEVASILQLRVQQISFIATPMTLLWFLSLELEQIGGVWVLDHLL